MAKQKDEAEQTPTQNAALISASTLKSLLRADDGYKEKIDGLTGELREEIANAVEKKHLDKKAYALLKKFYRIKSNEKLAGLWDTLQAYMDLAGVMKRIESVAPLPLDGEKNEEEAEGDGKVTPIRSRQTEGQATA